MSDLVSSSLRMRPDRIVIGEVRTPEEVVALSNSMLAGQGKGSIATFHAGSAREALTRLTSLGANPADLSAIDLIITQRRWTRFDLREEVRRVVEICSVSKEYDATRPPEPNPVFSFDVKADSLKLTDVSSPASEKLVFSFSSNERVLAELKSRARFLTSAPRAFSDFSLAAHDRANG